MVLGSTDIQGQRIEGAFRTEYDVSPQGIEERFQHLLRELIENPLITTKSSSVQQEFKAITGFLGRKEAGELIDSRVARMRILPKPERPVVVRGMLAEDDVTEVEAVDHNAAITARALLEKGMVDFDIGKGMLLCFPGDRSVEDPRSSGNYVIGIPVDNIDLGSIDYSEARED